jgi:Flp pilus assembly pilin Flp
MLHRSQRSKRGAAVKGLGRVGRFSRCFWQDERGTTAIEYSLVSSGIALLILGAVAVLGNAVLGKYLAVLAAMP